MSRIKFSIDSDNVVKIITSDYQENQQYISVTSNGDEKIVTLSISDLEIEEQENEIE
jgi:DNA-binding protein YbaB